MELEHDGRRYRVTAEDMVIGADPACGIVLSEASPRHAAVRGLGDRMATIRALEPGAEVLVNGVAVGREPTPLLHGDTVRIAGEALGVVNPGHPAGGPTTPPPGARERLHDTLFGVPRSTVAEPEPAPPPPAAGSRLGVAVAAVASLLLLAWLLFR